MPFACRFVTFSKEARKAIPQGIIEEIRWVFHSLGGAEKRVRREGGISS